WAGGARAPGRALPGSSLAPAARRILPSDGGRCLPSASVELHRPHLDGSAGVPSPPAPPLCALMVTFVSVSFASSARRPMLLPPEVAGRAAAAAGTAATTTRPREQVRGSIAGQRAAASSSALSRSAASAHVCSGHLVAGNRDV